MTYDANSSKMVVMGNALTTNASSYSTYITALTIGTSSISSQGTPQQLDSQISSSSTHGGTENSHSVIYDPTGYKLLFGYVKRNSSDADNRVRLKVGSLSGTTFTFGSHTELSDTGMGVQVGYDGNLNKFSAIRSSRSTSPYSTSFYNLTYNNSLAITLSTEVDCPSDEGWGMYGVNYNLPYISYNRSIYGTQRPISSAGYATNLKYWSFQSKKVVETTNYDASKYFGVASSTASTTEPVGVNRSGSFNNDQTGMTAGKDMYVTDAGLIKERTTTTVTPNTTPTVTTPNNDTTYTYTDYADLQYDSASSHYFKTYRAQDNSGYATMRTGTWDSTNNNIAWTTPQVLTSYSYRGMGVFGASGDGIVMVLSSLVNASDNIQLFSGVIDSTTGVYTKSNIFVDTATSTSSNYLYPQGLTYHATANRFIFVWAKGNTADQTVYVNTAYKDTRDRKSVV